jgi:hypothetical protein
VLFNPGDVEAMRKIISLMIVLLPCAAFAATDCRFIEYPDHYEAICIGDADKTPASQIAEKERIPGQEQTLASAQTPESEQLDVAPEKIVRNDLARFHGASWLKTRPGQ